MLQTRVGTIVGPVRRVQKWLSMSSSHKTVAFGFLQLLSPSLRCSFTNKSRNVHKDFDYPKYHAAVEQGKWSRSLLIKPPERYPAPLRPLCRNGRQKFVIDGDTGDEENAFSSAIALFVLRKQPKFVPDGIVPVVADVVLRRTFILLFKQLQVGGGKAMSFGKVARNFSRKIKTV